MFGLFLEWPLNIRQVLCTTAGTFRKKMKNAIGPPAIIGLPYIIIDCLNRRISSLLRLHISRQNHYAAVVIPFKTLDQSFN